MGRLALSNLNGGGLSVTLLRFIVLVLEERPSLRAQVLGLLGGIGLMGRKPSRRAVSDTVLPAVWIGGAFAIIENIYYLTGPFREVENLLLVGGRLLLPPLAHLCFAVLMGVLYGLAEDGGLRRFLLFPAALLLPIALHGLWDWIAFSADIYGGWILVAGIPVVILLPLLTWWMLRWARRREMAGLADAAVQA